MQSSNLCSRAQAPRRDAPVQCPVCARTVQRKSRQQLHCSTRCRKIAWREKSPVDALKKPPGYHPGGRGTNPNKSSNENNSLQQLKTGSSPRIIGPRRVIQAEVIGAHEWQEVVSASGVTSYIRQPGKRVLVGGAS